jgi:hypothetical protein
VSTSSRECPPGGGFTWSSHNRGFSRAVMPIFPAEVSKGNRLRSARHLCFEFQAVENPRCQATVDSFPRLVRATMSE